MEIRSPGVLDTPSECANVTQAILVLSFPPFRPFKGWTSREPASSHAEGGARSARRQEVNAIVFESRSGDVAQLGEHLLCKQGVTGSSPVISTSTLSTE